VSDLSAAFPLALSLIVQADATLLSTVWLSLGVSLLAVFAASVIGLPLGASVALGRFPGRAGLTVMFNAFMGLPPVVVGLVVYLLLSRAGPLGDLGLLFTPSAMVVAQTILVLPIITALTRQVIDDLWEEYGEQLRSLGCTPLRAIPTLLWDGRYRLATVVLAGFGRASAEVGAVMIVGGNIAGVTRTMTTSIALQTGRGDLPLALAFGFILILLTTAVNGLTYLVGDVARRGMR